jgi:hypothetical protein
LPMRKLLSFVNCESSDRTIKTCNGHEVAL